MRVQSVILAAAEGAAGGERNDLTKGKITLQHVRRFWVLASLGYRAREKSHLSSRAKGRKATAPKVSGL
jgi:hypothetical protein